MEIPDHRFFWRLKVHPAKLLHELEGHLLSVGVLIRNRFQLLADENSREDLTRN